MSSLVERKVKWKWGFRSSLSPCPSWIVVKNVQPHPQLVCNEESRVETHMLTTTMMMKKKKKKAAADTNVPIHTTTLSAVFRVTCIIVSLIFFGGNMLRLYWRLTTSSLVSRHEGHFTHKPRAVTMEFWESKRKCPRAVPSHLYNHVVRPRTLECSVKSYVTKSSTKCYLWISIHVGPNTW